MTAPIPNPPYNIRITRLSEDGGKFPGILTDDASQFLRENAFVLHNEDKRDVVGLYAEWIITDQTGHTWMPRYTNDSYLASIHNPVIESNHEAIISPAGVILPKVYSPALWQSMASTVQSVTTHLQQASGIRLSVDTIAFSDGEICGPNSHRLDRILIERNNAARLVAAEVQRSIASGENWRPNLKKLQISPHSFDQSTKGYWIDFYTNRFLLTRAGAERTQELVAFYHNLPSLPTFYPCRVATSSPAP